MFAFYIEDIVFFSLFAFLYLAFLFSVGSFVTPPTLPHAALRVTRPLQSVSVAETQAATFECEVSHFNVPSTWLKNGVEIEMSDRFRMVVQGKLHQLKITNTGTEDSAEYTFVCGNDRVSATLTVSREFFLAPPIRSDLGQVRIRGCNNKFSSFILLVHSVCFSNDVQAATSVFIMF